MTLRRVVLLCGLALASDAVESLAECLVDPIIETASDAETALERLTRRRGRVDLAFIDRELPSSLPGVTGVAVIRTITQAYPWVPVVAVVARGCGEELVIQAVRCGAKDVVLEPLAGSDVGGVVARLVTPRRVGVQRAEDVDAGVKTMIAFVEGHFDAPLALRDLARMARMSPWHFSRRFRQLAGKPFRTFLIACRLARAKELLGCSVSSVTEIAHEVGFYDLSHFDRTFRKHFGCAPSEMARRRGGRAPGRS